MTPVSLTDLEPYDSVVATFLISASGSSQGPYTVPLRISRTVMELLSTGGSSLFSISEISPTGLSTAGQTVNIRIAEYE